MTTPNDDDPRTLIILHATEHELIIIRLRAALRGAGFTGKQIQEIIDDAN